MKIILLGNCAAQKLWIASSRIARTIIAISNNWFSHLCYWNWLIIIISTGYYRPYIWLLSVSSQIHLKNKQSVQWPIYNEPQKSYVHSYYNASKLYSNFDFRLNFIYSIALLTKRFSIVHNSIETDWTHIGNR